MSVLVRLENFENLKGKYILTKGAPEVIYNLLKNKDERILQKYTELAKEGYRVLALAMKEFNEDANKDR